MMSWTWMETVGLERHAMSLRWFEAGNPNLAARHIQTVAVMIGQPCKMQVVISLFGFS